MRIRAIMVLGVALGASGTLGAALPASGASRFDGSLAFLVGSPQGAFADQVDATGFGLDLAGGWRPGGGAAVLGARVGWMSYGRETRREPFNPNIPEVTIEVETTNNLVLGHVFLRLQPADGAVRPFVQGLVGFGYLYTESAVRNERNNEEIASTTNFDDTVLEVGGGGGVDIRVWQNAARPKGPHRAYVQIKADYLSGGEGRYLKKGSLVVENGQLTYDVQRSETDLLVFTAGVTIEFGS